MKTQKTISMRELLTILVVILLGVTACGSEQESTAQENGKQTVSSSVPKPPSVDIHTAAFMGNIKAIEQHISAGSDLNVKDQYGSTPLIIATTFGKTEVAKALINGGADLSIAGNDGSTPLHTAAFFCRVEIVKALLAKGANKNIKNSYGSTPLASVSAPFDQVKGIYDQISKDLGPLGLKFDYKYLETTRPIIARMLQ